MFCWCIAQHCQTIGIQIVPLETQLVSDHDSFLTNVVKKSHQMALLHMLSKAYIYD